MSIKISDHPSAAVPAFCNAFSLMIIEVSWRLLFVIAATSTCSLLVKSFSLQQINHFCLAPDDVSVPRHAFRGTFFTYRLILLALMFCSFFVIAATCTLSVRLSGLQQIKHFSSLALFDVSVPLRAFFGTFSLLVIQMSWHLILVNFRNSYYLLFSREVV